MSVRNLPADQLFQRALDGDRRCLGRLLTLVEQDRASAEQIAKLAHPLAGRSHVVGITGAPGSGKSTLTGRLIALLAEADRKTAVLAVDPSSPLTGGAILGDRVRMEAHAGPNTFIRSMATRGHQGGLSLAVPGVIRLLAAVGYDPIIIETVGVGQVEVDIAGTADTTVVVATPGMGDAVQANKAGLLELADLFVVNKSDRPGANDVKRDLEIMLELSHATGHDRHLGRQPEIVMTSALKGDGAEDMWQAVERHRTAINEDGTIVARRQRRDIAELRFRLLSKAEKMVEAILKAETSTAVIDQVKARELSPSQAAKALFD